MAAPSTVPEVRPGERLLYEGRPHGRSPLLRDWELMFYVNGALAAVLFAVVYAALLRRPVLWQPGSLLPPPSPLYLLPAGGALLLYQWASWRSRRYLVTDQRLLVIEGIVRASAQAYDRTGAETVERRLDGVLEVTGLAGGGSVRLPGLDQADLDTLREVLGSPPAAAPGGDAA